MDMENSTENPHLILDKFSAQNIDWNSIVNKVDSKEHWHKFIVSTGSIYDKTLVLNTILDAISPVDLVPVKYATEGKNSVFLARNCGPAIRKLVDMDFTLHCLTGNSRSINLSVHICHSPIDSFQIVMVEHIKNVLKKQFCKKTFHLDLSEFHNNTEFGDLIFCPLRFSKFLNYVLLTISFDNIKSMSLARNRLLDIKPLESLSRFKDLKRLDLSQNELDETTDFSSLQQVTSITSLLLADNPIGAKLNSKDYVDIVTKNIPQIEKLDDCRLDHVTGLAVIQCYMCDTTITPVIDQFLSLYFNYYDHERSKLLGYYNTHAQFSFSADVKVSNSEPHNINLMLRSRNILQWSKSCKIKDVLLRNGAEDIVKYMCLLPTTQHDPNSFNVDVVYNDNNIIMINVSGVMQSEHDLKHFDRTFVLMCVSSDQYEIINDMLYVTNCDNHELEESFHGGTTKLPATYKEARYTNEEKKLMVELLSKLTNVGTSYSTKCLNDSDWDLEAAVRLFQEAYNKVEIPLEAFDKTDRPKS